MKLNFFSLCLLYCCVVFISEIDATNVKSKFKLVIDNDAGGDDAMALLLALLYERHFDGPKIVGFLTTHGNVYEDQSYLNNQKILKLAQRQDIPIYRGVNQSLLHTTIPDRYFGDDGLGDTNITFTDLVAAQNGNAVTKLIELSKTYEGELVVVTLGALTNIALAMKIDPDFLGRLKHMYVGAGHIQGERYQGPEFNVYADVEAYRVVLENSSPDVVSVLPYSQTQMSLNISKIWREQVFGGLPTDIVKAQNQFERFYLQKNNGWYALDPAVVACAIKEELIKEVKYTKQDIAICGKERGIITNEFGDEKDANFRLIYAVDQEAYKKFLMDVFSAELDRN